MLDARVEAIALAVVGIDRVWTEARRTPWAASFYAPFSAAGTVGTYHSSGYRLAANGSVSASIDVRQRVGAWEWVIGIERLRAHDALGFGGEPDPGRVSYTQIQAGFDYHFE